MRAISVKQPGGAEQLQIIETQKPVPQAGELLVRVEAASVNRLDIGQRETRADFVPGVEVAGVVEAVGAETKMPAGTRVTGLVKGGGYAEYALMPEPWAMEIPENLSFEEGAAIPEVFLTAYQTLFWLGRLKQDETVLIHAGGSGVGTAAIQLAKQLAGARVMTTAGSAEKLAVCADLGADLGMNYKEQQFDEEVLEATDGKGVDLILDFVGASYWEKNLASVKTDGRWVLIGTLGGAEVNQVNLFSLMQKRIQLTGTLLTPRSDAYKAELTAAFSSKCMELFEQGELKPVVDRIFPLDDAQAAHQHMENNQNIGKIILKV